MVEPARYGMEFEFDGARGRVSLFRDATVLRSRICIESWRGDRTESMFCHELRMTLTVSKGEQALVRRAGPCCDDGIMRKAIG